MKEEYTGRSNAGNYDHYITRLSSRLNYLLDKGRWHHVVTPNDNTAKLEIAKILNILGISYEENTSIRFRNNRSNLEVSIIKDPKKSVPRKIEKIVDISAIKQLDSFLEVTDTLFPRGQTYEDANDFLKDKEIGAYSLRYGNPIYMEEYGKYSYSLAILTPQRNVMHHKIPQMDTVEELETVIENILTTQGLVYPKGFHRLDSHHHGSKQASQHISNLADSLNHALEEGQTYKNTTSKDCEELLKIFNIVGVEYKENIGISFCNEQGKLEVIILEGNPQSEHARIDVQTIKSSTLRQLEDFLEVIDVLHPRGFAGNNVEEGLAGQPVGTYMLRYGNPLYMEQYGRSSYSLSIVNPQGVIKHYKVPQMDNICELENEIAQIVTEGGKIHYPDGVHRIDYINITRLAEQLNKAWGDDRGVYTTRTAEENFRIAGILGLENKKLGVKFRNNQGNLEFCHYDIRRSAADGERNYFVPGGTQRLETVAPQQVKQFKNFLKEMAVGQDKGNNHPKWRYTHQQKNSGHFCSQKEQKNQENTRPSASRQQNTNTGGFRPQPESRRRENTRPSARSQQSADQYLTDLARKLNAVWGDDRGVYTTRTAEENFRIAGILGLENKNLGVKFRNNQGNLEVCYYDVRYKKTDGEIDYFVPDRRQGIVIATPEQVKQLDDYLKERAADQTKGTRSQQQNTGGFRQQRQPSSGSSFTSRFVPQQPVGSTLTPDQQTMFESMMQDRLNTLTKACDVYNRYNNKRPDLAQKVKPRVMGCIKDVLELCYNGNNRAGVLGREHLPPNPQWMNGINKQNLEEIAKTIGESLRGIASVNNISMSSQGNISQGAFGR